MKPALIKNLIERYEELRELVYKIMPGDGEVREIELKDDGIEASITTYRSGCVDGYELYIPFYVLESPTEENLEQWKKEREEAAAYAKKLRDECYAREKEERERREYLRLQKKFNGSVNADKSVDEIVEDIRKNS